MSPTIGFPLFAVRSGLFPLKREEGSRGRELSSKVVSFQRRCWNCNDYFKCGDAGRVDVDIGCINFEPTYHVGKGKVSQKIKSHKVSWE